MPTTSGYAGVAADNAAVGTVSWIDDTEAQGAPDATTADVSLSSSNASHMLLCSAFGLLLPGGANVTSITVASRIRSSRSAGSLDSSIRVILKLPDGSYSPQNVLWIVPSDNTLRDYSATGNSSLTFGVDPSSLSEAVIEDSTFSVALYAQADGSGATTTFGVDSVQVTVDYTPTVTFTAATMVPDDRMQVEWPPSKRFNFSF